MHNNTNKHDNNYHNDMHNNNNMHDNHRHNNMHNNNNMHDNNYDIHNDVSYHACI